MPKNQESLGINLLNLASLDIIDVASDGNIQHQWALLEERNVIPNTLLQIAKGKERNVIDILVKVFSDLGLDVEVGECKHATVSLLR